MKPDGGIYFVGETDSVDFPLKNPTQGSHGGGIDLFISKFNAQATVLEYSTYLGKSNDETFSYNALDLSRAGNIYIACSSNSVDMELVNPIQGANLGGKDIYVAKLGMDEAPSVEIVSPVDGQTVSGMVEIDIEAGDDIGVVMVNVYVDGELKSTDWDLPYRYDWDSSLTANGVHRIKAEAIDTMGFASEHEIKVEVRNAEITLAAVRRDDRGWLVRKKYGLLEFSIKKPEGISVDSYDVYRRVLSGNLEKIGSVPDANPDLLIQKLRFTDFRIPSDKTCSYCVLAVSESGEVLGISNTCVL